MVDDVSEVDEAYTDWVDAVLLVCQWIGNSQPIAAKYSLQVTDDHFSKALQQLAVLANWSSVTG